MLLNTQRSQTDIGALELVARLRYVTIPLLVAHLSRSPDASYRLVRRLVRDGLLRSFVFGRAQREGPPSVVCVLTARGAGALADAGIEERAALTRILKSTSARARDVESGLITTLGHDLDVLTFHALLTLWARRQEGLTLWWPQWTQAFAVQLEPASVAALTSSERLRIAGGAAGLAGDVAYVPDAVIRMEAGDATALLFVEVETGKGSRRPEAIGAVKGAKMLALQHRMERTGDLEGIGRVAASGVRFVTWCPTTSFRDRFLVGVRRVTKGELLPILAVSDAELSLRIPPGTPKAEVAPTLSRMASAFGGEIWTGLVPGAQRPAAALTTSVARETLAVGTSAPMLPFDPFGDRPLLPS